VEFRAISTWMTRWITALVLVSCFAFEAQCERFPLEYAESSVVGDIRQAHARGDDTLIDIAREFDLGYDQIVSANPDVNRWIPGEGTVVTLPSQYILPGAVRKGLVLNIAELRLYYYPATAKGSTPDVLTYPVSIGRMDWRTPLGITKVVRKERDPVWRPPPSIRAEHAREGEELPNFIAGGDPTNPLGRFALRLGIPSYLIHGVDERKAFGIGMRVTHGCIRMYPEDIEELFGLVPANTQVAIVDEPIKIGRLGDRVFLSVHQPLDEGEDEYLPPLPRVTVGEVMHHLSTQMRFEAQVDTALLGKIVEVGDGTPREIARVSDFVSYGERKTGTAETKKPSSINDEYQKAVSRYLQNSEKEQEDSRRPEAPRRQPRSQYEEADDIAVRQYLEERY
jgi:L,D-transpeptidase ErfK/SrfK